MRGLWWYLGLCFGLSWSWWELVIRSGVPVLSWQFSLLAIPGGFGPAIAAIIVRKWITREGFADAGLRLRPRRWRYYVLAWLLPVLVVTAIISQAALFGIAAPDFTLSRAAVAGVAGRSTAGIDRLGLLIVPQIMIVAVVATPLLWGEEFGWRGYLQPRIFPGRPVRAAIATGIIWALWHYPLTLRGYNYPDHPVWGSVLFIPLCVMLAYLFGWLCRRTDSIWSSSLAHSATNSIGGLPTLWFAGAASTLVTSYGGLFAIGPLFAACVVVWLADRRHSQNEDSETATLHAAALR